MIREEPSVCEACHGKGWNDEWKQVSGHYMGGEFFCVECAPCEGAGTTAGASQ